MNVMLMDLVVEAEIYNFKANKKKNILYCYCNYFGAKFNYLSFNLVFSIILNLFAFILLIQY